MKIIQVVWRDPVDDLKSEQYEAEKFKVSTDASWFKLVAKGTGHVARLIPACRIRLVEFGEIKDEPRVLQLPKN